MREFPENRKALFAGLLVLAVVLAYVPALYGGFMWDDGPYIAENPTLVHPDGAAASFFDLSANPQYYPLVFLSFRVERGIWGLWPMGYHLVNVLLHALAALLLWRILAGLGAPGAFFAAAAFALHPINVESVAWAAERKNTLSGFFFLAALGVFLHWVKARDRLNSADRGALYGLSFLLFVAALLSKTVTAVFPVAALLGIYYLKWKAPRRDILALVPFFAAALFMGIVTLNVETGHVGATGADWDHTPLERILVAGRGFWFYIGKILFPHGFAFFYERVLPSPQNPISWLWPISAAAILGLVFLFRKRAPGPFAALFYYALAVAPSLGFVSVFPHRYSFVADHFAYLAGMGIMALAAGLLARTFEKFPRNAQWLKIAGALAVLGFLGASTFVQAGAYRDKETLWRRTIEASPRAFAAHNNLGALLDRTGRHAEALEHYLAALAIQESPEAHYNLAGSYDAAGDLTRSRFHLARAMAIRSSDPRAYYHLGLLVENQGRPDDAVALYQKALEVGPGFPDAEYRLGLILTNQGRFGQAIHHLNRALLMAPSNAGAHQAVGAILMAWDRPGPAAAHFRKALAAQPKNPDLSAMLGQALARQGLDEEAAERFKTALAERPGHPWALQGMGFLLAKQGKPDEAIQSFLDSLAADPDSFLTHEALAVLYAKQGDAEKAGIHRKRASELKALTLKALGGGEPGSQGP